MLIEFRVRNFRSFFHEQVFQYPGLTGRKAENSRVAVVFGPNGGGKSNLILALATLRNLVLHSATCTERQYAEQYVPFQFGHAEDPTTEFEIEVQLDHTRYRYSLAYDAQRIWFERLLVYRTGKPQRWFERHYDPLAKAEHWAPFSPSFSGTRELWRRMTRAKALFLTTAARLDCEQLQPLARWFEHGLSIWFPSDSTDLGTVAAQIRDPAMKQRLVETLNAADIPVQDIRIADGAPAEEWMIDASRAAGTVHPAEGHRVELRYDRPGAAPVWVDSADEGRGTLRLLKLLGPLLPAMEHGTLLVMDEFAVGLHPLVARFVVQLVRHSPLSHSGVQLLMTSHYASLMVPEILDHNQIWLMERDSDRGSHLTPVSVHGARKGERLARGYLRGRYGAVPRIQPDSVSVQSPADASAQHYGHHRRSA